MTAAHLTPDPERPPAAPVPITVRGPAALAAALPYLIDAPLAGRAVIAVLDDQGLLRWLAHHALAEFPSSASPEVRLHWADEMVRTIEHGLTAVGAVPPESVVVVIYLPAAMESVPQWLAVRARSCLAPRGRLLDMIAVFADRWLSLLCTDPACCHPSGAPVLDDSEAVGVCAELVGLGLASAPTAGAGTDDPLHDEVAGRLASMLHPGTVAQRKALLRRAWPLVRAGAAASAEDHATLILAADRPGVRDAVLTRLARRDKRGGAALWRRQEALWREVAGAAPAEWAPGPACMLAVARWARNDRVGALTALEPALAAEPDHRMAGLITQLVGAGVSAKRWFAQMTAIAEDDCLRFDRPSTRAQRPTRSVADVGEG